MLDRLVALLRILFSPPLPALRWATLHLMGHQVVHGLVRAPAGGIVHVRPLRADGSFGDAWYSQGAIYGVEHDTEREVRLAFLRSEAGLPGLACKSFTPTRVVEGVCSRCVCTPEEHERAREIEGRRARYGQIREEARSIIAKIVGVEPGLVTAVWDSGDAAVVRVHYRRAASDETYIGLTAAEWQQALARGAVLGPFPDVGDEEAAPDSIPQGPRS